MSMSVLYWGAQYWTQYSGCGLSSTGVVPPQVQDFALPLVELHVVPVSPFIQLVEAA